MVAPNSSVGRDFHSSARMIRSSSDSLEVGIVPPISVEPSRPDAPLFLPLSSFDNVESEVIGYRLATIHTNLTTLNPMSSRLFKSEVMVGFCIYGCHHLTSIGKHPTRRQPITFGRRLTLVLMPGSSFHSIVVDAIDIAGHLDDYVSTSIDLAKSPLALELKAKNSRCWMNGV